MLDFYYGEKKRTPLPSERTRASKQTNKMSFRKEENEQTRCHPINLWLWCQLRGEELFVQRGRHCRSVAGLLHRSGFIDVLLLYLLYCFREILNF